MSTPKATGDIRNVIYATEHFQLLVYTCFKGDIVVYQDQSSTISQGLTFMVTDEQHGINPRSDAGVYTMDTRFINRELWVLVNSCHLSFYAAPFYR
jgi:hypothetical protein